MDVEGGVRKVIALFSILFIIAMDDIQKDVKARIRWNAGCILFAHDLVILRKIMMKFNTKFEPLEGGD